MEGRNGDGAWKSGARSWKRPRSLERQCRAWRGSHDVNANQVFYWRNLYREGRLGSTGATKLLPVKVAEERSLEAKDDGLARRWGTMEIQLAKGTVRIAGAVDVVALRATIECLVA